MLYFGSRNFGQANYGHELISKATVDEVTTTSNMDAAGYLLFNTGTLVPKAVANVDVAAGIQRMGHLDIRPSSTVIASRVLMEWHPQLATPKSTTTAFASGFIAWDSLFVDDATWTTQTVD